MKFMRMVRAASILGRARLLKQRIPFAVSWALSYRCNARCAYCRIYRGATAELNTDDVCRVIDRLIIEGMCRLSFTGGEPLLREDIDTIVGYTCRKNVFTSLSTNGILVPEKISVLKHLDRIGLSLDGSENVNDRLRGEGSYRYVLEALQVLRRTDVQRILHVVLSRGNVHDFEHVLDVAAQYNAKVFFQPGTIHLLGTVEENPEALGEAEYKVVIDKLIAMKKKGVSYIANSLAGLRHLSYWPHPQAIFCSAGSLFQRIEPDGSMRGCSRKGLGTISCPDRLSPQGRRSMPAAVAQKNCRSCWCAPLVEYNLALSFNSSAIRNVLQKI